MVRTYLQTSKRVQKSLYTQNVHTSPNNSEPGTYLQVLLADTKVSIHAKTIRYTFIFEVQK